MIMTALAAAAGVGAGVATFGAVAPNSSLFGPVIGRGPRDRSLYLTFDDGPHPDWTSRILTVLSEQEVPAVFFVVGKYACNEPDVVRAITRAGHTIGNHTWSHHKLHLRSPAYIRDELLRTHACITEATGIAPRAFRAPHGYRNPFVGRATNKLGYTTFGWTFGVWDTARPGIEAIRARMRKGLRPGAILLLHDGDGYDARGDRSQTAAALPCIIEDARALGYEFRPLSDLLPA